MTVVVERSRAEGAVTAPPSKSMAHRALICAALSQGSRVMNIAESEDISATIGCLKSLGAKVETDGDCVTVGGLDPFSAEGCELFCNESGSTLRFMIPLCLLSGKRITLTGSPRLMERPLSIYEDICKEQGIEFKADGKNVTLCGKLKSGVYTVPGNISSQFISGLLFTLPLLDGDSIIEVTGKFESESYTDLTLKALSDFGVKIERCGASFIIPGNQKYVETEYTVEGDCSNAAFLEAFNLLGGNVTVNGISDGTLQGDRVYIDMFKGLENGVKEFDLSDCPDLAPVMFAMAAVKGGALFTGTKRLKIKESDRASVMAEELKKFGINVIVEEDTVEVCKGDLTAPAQPLNGHNDHRIVMSLALLCTLTGGEIEGAEAVAKSFPDFFDKIKALKVGITEK